MRLNVCIIPPCLRKRVGTPRRSTIRKLHGSCKIFKTLRSVDVMVHNFPLSRLSFLRPRKIVPQRHFNFSQTKVSASLFISAFSFLILLFLHSKRRSPEAVKVALLRCLFEVMARTYNILIVLSRGGIFCSRTCLVVSKGKSDTFETLTC